MKPQRERFFIPLFFEGLLKKPFPTKAHLLIFGFTPLGWPNPALRPPPASWRAPGRPPALLSLGPTASLSLASLGARLPWAAHVEKDLGVPALRVQAGLESRSESSLKAALPEGTNAGMEERGVSGDRLNRLILEAVKESGLRHEGAEVSIRSAPIYPKDHAHEQVRRNKISGAGLAVRKEDTQEEAKATVLYVLSGGSPFSPLPALVERHWESLNDLRSVPPDQLSDRIRHSVLLVFPLENLQGIQITGWETLVDSPVNLKKVEAILVPQVVEQVVRKALPEFQDRISVVGDIEEEAKLPRGVVGSIKVRLSIPNYVDPLLEIARKVSGKRYWIHAVRLAANDQEAEKILAGLEEDIVRENVRKIFSQEFDPSSTVGNGFESVLKPLFVGWPAVPTDRCGAITSRISPAVRMVSILSPDLKFRHFQDDIKPLTPLKKIP